LVEDVVTLLGDWSPLMRCLGNADVESFLEFSVAGQLDNWSSYLSPLEYEEMTTSLQGGDSGASRTVLAADLPGNVAYLRVSHFAESTVQEIVEQLTQQTKPAPTGLVLDLRGNPGGLLAAGVKTVDLFVAEGMLLSHQGRSADSCRQYQAQPGDPFESTERLPIVVLVDGLTASAAEIVAGSLKELGRAVVVGSTTYAKSTTQQITGLPDGGGFKYTYARYFLPKGTSPSASGIVPGVCTSSPTISAEQILTELSHGRTSFAGQMSLGSSPAGESTDVEAAQIRTFCPARVTAPATSAVGPEADADLAVALALLQHRDVYDRLLPPKNDANVAR
jgi:hypothetical protein